MPRRPLIRSNCIPYHVTARGNNREAFPCALDRAWEILCNSLFECSILYESQFHAFVMMPNHLHLLLTTPKEDVGITMQCFMKSVTKTMNRVSGRSGHIFGARYHWCLIDSPLYFAHALKYVYRNPVRAGLVSSVGAYPFSTLSGLLGHQALQFPLHFPFGGTRFPILPSETGTFVSWLDHPSRKETEDALRKGMRKSRFAPPRESWQKSADHLKFDLSGNDASAHEKEADTIPS
jgi:putative transposase